MMITPPNRSDDERRKIAYNDARSLYSDKTGPRFFEEVGKASKAAGRRLTKGEVDDIQSKVDTELGVSRPKREDFFEK